MEVRGEYMAVNKIEVETTGIKRALKKFNTFSAISQYIWNGFDANATTIKVDLIKNQFNGISGLIVKDNGYGINSKKLQYKFKNIFESNKTVKKRANKNSSHIRGENGIGRFTFFTFASRAEWTTIYEDDGVNYKYKIIMDASNLDEYIDTEPEVTTETVGTTVEFMNFQDQKFDLNEYNEYMMLEFAWYLELNSENNYQLILDGTAINYSSILENKQEKTYCFEETQSNFDVTFCIWNKKLHEEYSKYYYINSKNIEQFKENTTLNNKGDKFFHSVYIKSKIFDDFRFEDEDDQISFINGKDSDEYKFVIRKIDSHLKNMRNPYIKEYTKTYIYGLKKNGAYPKLDNKNAMDKFREESLDKMIETIYSAQPKIFTGLNIPQQKTLVRLFDMSLQSGEIDSLYKIIEGVLDMQVQERDELANLLEYTKMSHITKAITLIKDRLQAIADLKQLVLNKDLKANERDHLQKLIEQHYWIFGEEFHLVTAEEPDFEEALRRFIYLLRGEKHSKGSIKIDDKNKQKEMDVFAVQRKLDGEIKKSIIVELKHPTITLGSKQLQQVKDYFNVIDKEDRFKGDNIEWIFYLIGNKFNSEIRGEIENAKSHGERSLAYNVNRKKIYVKTWSEIFTEQEINYNFLQEKLMLQQEMFIKRSRNKTANEIATEQKGNTAVRPNEIVI